MESRKLAVTGAVAFTPRTFRDERGVFSAPFQQPAFEAARGGPLFAVAQSNHSVSRRGVVRGIHYTGAPPGAAKYVSCVSGRALDIVVDIRPGSPTYGRWDAVQLDGSAPGAVYLPVGVGHAFVALTDDTVMSYLVSAPYVPENEYALSPLDPALALPIPKDLEPLLSERDTRALTLEEAERSGLLPPYELCRELEERLGTPAAVRDRAVGTRV
ncbi:dTDP-4-dehydrorhamnose 3,5-epimerase family protein [Streptomyces phyllanthi]|uniref:dTDP-4-keto-6-deoxy-D-glucose epimerase n=1 Tax=Streptomyces phyllanthi TaxID=1803180 RepID=A0A5N8W1F9_9ACTN|nr:dTDP-4-keto-6-deoxy-D-glucose epimerase [Streptomyces phyllanthi]